MIRLWKQGEMLLLSLNLLLTFEEENYAFLEEFF